MKTIIEIAGEVLRKSKAMPARRGESLRAFFSDSPRARLDLKDLAEVSLAGWRSVFGQARPEELEGIDEIVVQEFEAVDSDTWK